MPAQERSLKPLLAHLANTCNRLEIRNVLHQVQSSEKILMGHWVCICLKVGFILEKAATACNRNSRSVQDLAGVLELRQQAARVLLTENLGKVVRNAFIECQVQRPYEARNPTDGILQSLHTASPHLTAKTEPCLVCQPFCTYFKYERTQTSLQTHVQRNFSVTFSNLNVEGNSLILTALMASTGL